jgi:hypothetical protein
MAHHAHKPRSRSLPPLSFGDPELDLHARSRPSLPANDVNLSRDAIGSAHTQFALPVASRPSVPALDFGPAPSEPPAPIYLIPSIPPVADPSFQAVAHDAAPVSKPPAPLPVVVLPALAAPSVEERITALLERCLDQIPLSVREHLAKTPIEVAYGLALVGIFGEIGMCVRMLRSAVAMISPLFR